MKKHMLIGGLALVLSITQNYAQTPELVDSLLQNLNTATLDSVKADAMLSLSGVFRNSNPERALGYAQQALDLSRSINYIKGQASALFHFGAINSGQSDYSSALKYYQQALSIAENSTLKREPVQYKLNIGIIYDITGDAAKAMEIYEEVLEDSRVIKDTVLETSAFQNMAILHVYQGELSKAKEYFIKAKNVVEKINHPEMLGQITNNLATVYSQLYEFDSAKVYYQESLELWKNRENQFQVARTMYNMAIDELETGSGQEAERLWKRSLEIREQLGDARGVGLCQSALGSYYSDRRDYSKAVNFFQQSLHSFEKAGLKREIVSTRTNMALAQHKMGELKAANEGLAAALSLAEEIQDLTGIANAHYHLGLVEFEMDNLEIAAQRLDWSAENFEKVKNWEGVGKSLHQRGKVAQSQGLEQAALSYYQKSWQTYNQVFNTHEKLSEVYNTTSHYYLERNDMAKAHKFQELALQALIPDTLAAQEKHLLKATISLPSLLEVILTRARIKETKGSLYDALADYNQCLEIVDSLQADFRAESQQVLMGNAFAIYDGALEVLEQLYSQGNTEVLDQVLALMEGYKSLLLNEAFMRTQALEFAGVPSAVTRKEEAFKNRIGFLKQKIWDAQRDNDETGLAEIEGKLFMEENNYDNFKAQLRKDYPKYYQLRYTRSFPTVKEVQDKILSDDQAMVEYFIGKNKLFALAISPLGEQLISIPYSKELAADLTLFYQLSSKRTAIADYEAEVRKYAETAYHLYQSLLYPMETVLQNYNLIIIPDGALHFITFSGLLTEPSNELNFAKLPYLIRKVSTSYYYSAGLLQTSLQAGNREQPKSMLALTPEVRGPQEFDNLMAFREGDELGRIPGAYYEVVNIGELIGADFYTGTEVSESNFKRMANDYKVLHLAMHGVVDDQHPNFSRLVFNSENDTLNDGLLHTYELYNMKLNADLVVLSACNTGYGALMKGEGLLSLGHSFAYAGCPNILMSKWPAADQPTNELMQYFYAQIKDGVPKDEALRQAKLQYLGTGDKITTHPVFWANFVLVGNNLPVELERTSWAAWVVLGAVLLILISILLIKMRKRRKLVAGGGRRDDPDSDRLW